MSGGVAPFIPSHYLDVSGQLHVHSLYPQYPLSRQTDPGTQGHLQPPQMGAGPVAGLKRSGRGADHPPPSSTEVKENSGSSPCLHVTLQGKLYHFADLVVTV